MLKTTLENTTPLSPLSEQTLTWLLSMLSAIFVYSCIALIVSRIYTPDVASLKAAGDKLLISSTLVRPEPMEALLTRLGIFILPSGLLFFYRFFSKRKLVPSIAAKPFFTAFTVLCAIAVIALIYCDFAAQNPFAQGGGDIPQTARDARGGSNFDFYFGGLFLGNYLFIYLLAICPILASLFFIGFKKYHWDEHILFKRIANIAGYIAIAAIIACCIVMCTFYLPYSTENKFDFGAVYYSMTQVYAGTPMLVNGFTNTYGLYPHFLNPLFQLTGLSIFKFSLVMSLLLGAGFALNFYCLRQFVSNKIILFSGMFTLLFFSFLDFKFTENFDAGFALHSIRYIIPSVLLFLATRYLKKSTPLRYWSTTIIMAFFVLWNPEFGIISYIAWLLFLTCIGFYKIEGKPAYRKIVIIWATGTVVLAGAICLFEGIIYIAYGSAPDMSSLWSAIFIFGKLGFNLLPMSLLHPWNLMALIILSGFLYTISGMHKKSPSPKAAFVFLISVIATGFFLYFQGRSHNWNFALSCGMCIILLTILADELWSVIKLKSLPALNVLFVALLCIISFSSFEIAAGTGKIYSLLCQEDDKAKGADEQKIIEMEKEFIAANSEPNEKIYVLTLRKFQPLFFDGDKRVSAFNPGMIDLFLNSDITRLEKQLLDSSFKVFITPYAFFNLNFMSRPLAAMAATYECTNANTNIACAQKRATHIPPGTFFGKTATPLIHRKYNDDSTGKEMRIDDASGIKPITLSPDFSVELLFNSRPQAFPIATLSGNGDSTGFSISTNGTSGFFAINGSCYTLPLPGNGWTYCVLNVFPNHFEIYENGALVGRDALPKPIINSANNFCVGNLGYMHNYIGAISEVAVTNQTLDSARVTTTWNEIRTVLTSGR